MGNMYYCHFKNVELHENSVKVVVSIFHHILLSVIWCLFSFGFLILFFNAITLSYILLNFCQQWFFVLSSGLNSDLLFHLH